MDDQHQAEAIANRFANTGNRYNPLLDSDVSLPPIPEGSIPCIDPEVVFKFSHKIKTTTSTVKDDILAKVMKQFAVFIAHPLADIIDTCI